MDPCQEFITSTNIILRKDIPVSKSLIDYLDNLDAPATDNPTIYCLLCRTLIIKEKLRLSAMACIYDQDIFMKAVEIQFKEKEKFKSLLLVMGGFHMPTCNILGELLGHGNSAANWHLYLESIQSMLPWVFTCDCYNYSPY